ncbi:MAG: MCE family protein [Victivallales bacterium]|nr:MCE family protein [Victivallales bacterium]
MKKQQNQSVRLGLFITGALTLLIMLLLALGDGTLLSRPAVYYLVFNRSIKGLAVGSPVMFRGIRIGQVRDIQLAPARRGTQHNKALAIQVQIQIEPRALNLGAGEDDNFFDRMEIGWNWRFHAQRLVNGWIRNHVMNGGLRAQLMIQSLLTGQLYIQLDTFPHSYLTGNERQALFEGNIPVVNSWLDKLSESVGSDFQKRLQVFQKGLNIAANFIESGKAEETLQNLHKITSDTTAVMSDIRQITGKATTSVPSLLDEAKGTISNLNILMQTVTSNVSPLALHADELVLTTTNAIRNTTSKAEVLLVNLQETSQNLKNLSDFEKGPGAELLGSLKVSAVQAQAAFTELTYLLQEFHKELDPESPTRQELKSSLDEVQRATRAIRNLAETLESNPNALLFGKE